MAFGKDCFTGLQAFINQIPNNVKETLTLCISKYLILSEMTMNIIQVTTIICFDQGPFLLLPYQKFKKIRIVSTCKKKWQLLAILNAIVALSWQVLSRQANAIGDNQ